MDRVREHSNKTEGAHNYFHVCNMTIGVTQNGMQAESCNTRTNAAIRTASQNTHNNHHQCKPGQPTKQDLDASQTGKERLPYIPMPPASWTPSQTLGVASPVSIRFSSAWLPARVDVRRV